MIIGCTLAEINMERNPELYKSNYRAQEEK
jgi:hypothetical protein